jgi:hypothetical protein
VTILPVASVTATPPLLASVGLSSRSQRGEHRIGKRRSLTTMSADPHAAINAPAGTR